MAYYLQQFDTITLPKGAPLDGLGSGRVRASLVETSHGAFDM